MKLEGTFIKIFNKKTGTSKNGDWKLVEFAVSSKDNRVFAFSVFGEIGDEVEKANNGDEVEVDFKIECREWDGKYFTKLAPTSFVITKPVQEQQKNNTDVNELPF